MIYFFNTHQKLYITLKSFLNSLIGIIISVDKTITLLLIDFYLLTE